MPEREILEKFVIDPNYDIEKGLLKEIDEARRFFDKSLACIDKIEDTTIQLISIFSLIDCLAQEASNYATDFKKAFCDFVIKHQKQCDYIEMVEPITLYYRVEDLIEEKVLFEDFPPEKVVSLESLGCLDSTLVKDVLQRRKSEEILEYIKNEYGKDLADKLEKEHKIISLIYRMRSKAVHEMSGLGESSAKTKDMYPNTPHYRDVSRIYVYEGNVVSDDVVELVIPNHFLRNILSDCIDGYLEDCKKNKRAPFSNNKIYRLNNLSWYDNKPFKE